MPLGRPTATIILTEQEREILEQWTRRPKTAQATALRARIVLGCAAGEYNGEIAKRLRVSLPTVGKWRARFAKQRWQGLLDEPRPGAPRQIDDAAVERLLRRTLEAMPRAATHWSTRSMARASGLSQSSVSRIWRAFGLQPHRGEVFQLSKDPLFIDKVRDVVGLYMNPPARALVLCVDEKSQIQALDRSQPLLPMRPGQAERRTHDYLRHGTTTLFAALDVATGFVLGDCRARHRAREFRRFLELIDAATPRNLDLHLILDNYATHKTPAVRRWLVQHPRFHLHFIPTGSSWLNLVERWFALLTERRLRRGVFRSGNELVAAIRQFLDEHNRRPRPFIWTKTAGEILEKLSRFCQRTSDSGH